MIRKKVIAKPKCPTCEHSVFDETYGEYKCKKRCIRIYDISKYLECEHYKKITKTKEQDAWRGNSAL